MDYEKTGSVVGPVWCMGFDGIAVGVRWVAGKSANYYRISIQSFRNFSKFANAWLALWVGWAIHIGKDVT